MQKKPLDDRGQPQRGEKAQSYRGFAHYAHRKPLDDLGHPQREEIARWLGNLLFTRQEA